MLFSVTSLFARLDRKMGVSINGDYYVNDTAMICTLAIQAKEIGDKLYQSDYPEDTPVPIEHIEKSKKVLGREISILVPLIFKKQAKNFPVIKQLKDEFLSEFNTKLIEEGWINAVGDLEGMELLESVDRDELLNQSHPTFEKYFNDDMYKNYGDGDTPFGSDTGFDVLTICIDQYNNNNDINFWGLRDIILFKIFKLKENIESINTMTTLAVGLSEIKLTGKISLDLKKEMISVLRKTKNPNAVIILEDLENFKNNT